MTELIVFVGIAGVALVIILRQFWKWKAVIDAAKVQTRDAALFRDQQAAERQLRLATLQGKGAKGFAAQNDRRAHVHELKRKVH